MIRQGKGSKDRVVPLGKIAAKYLETYLNGIRPELMRYAADLKFKQLFISLRGRVLSKNALADLVASRQGQTDGSFLASRPRCWYEKLRKTVNKGAHVLR
jgi:site-specific recombinase XerD